MLVPGRGVEAAIAKIGKPKDHADYQAVYVAEKVVGWPVLDVVGDELFGAEMETIMFGFSSKPWILMSEQDAFL